MGKFHVQLNRRDVPETELLADLAKVAENLKKKTITVAEYKDKGTFGSTTMIRRFGSWNAALLKAGLSVSNRLNIPDEELFHNIAAVWTSLGRQPYGRELEKPQGLSAFSLGTYEGRFGSWNKALIAFDEFINTEEKVDLPSSNHEKSGQVDEKTSQPEVAKHKTKREISDRMRFRILMRDGFACKACGRSPVTEIGVELHVDHILPWSKGGETVEGNLSTKCKECNLGKGNAFEK